MEFWILLLTGCAGFTSPARKHILEEPSPISQQIIQLASRRQTLMFLREALYIFCELSLNHKIPPNEIKKLYTTEVKIKLCLNVN